MADGTQNLLLLHAEDVIFKKPSLKEFIRLIKNGTINAIWPSTQAEFNWWNEEGRYSYAHIRDVDDLKIKSIKTSMTVYYGDHQDSAATQILNIEETTNKFNALKDDFENKLQEQIITEKFFEEKADLMYPTLILNQDAGTINSNEIIAHNDNILTEYQKNLTYIQNLITEIESFIPTGVEEEIFLSDENLWDNYLNFFINKTNEINEIILNLSSFAYDIERIKKNNNIINEVTKYFYFENILPVITDYVNTIELLNNKISSYNIIDIREFNIAVSEAENYIQDFIDYKKDIADNIKKFINSIKLDHAYLLPVISSYQIKDLTAADVNRPNSLIANYVEPYELLYKNLLILQNNGLVEDQEDQASTFISSVINKINNVITEDKTQQEILQEKINIINNDCYAIINNLISSFKNNTNLQILINQYSLSLPTIEYCYEPLGIQDSVAILKDIEQFFNIIKSEFEIKDTYSLEVTTIENSDFYINLYNNDIYDLLLTTEQKIYAGAEEDAITELKKVLNQYGAIIDTFKNYKVTSVEREEEIEIDRVNKTIKNRDDLISSIDNQYNEIKDFLDAVKIIQPGFNLTESYNNLGLDRTAIITNIENVTVESKTSSTDTNFNNWVNEKFIKNEIALAIKHLIKTIYQNPEEDINTSNFIPSPSENYLEIANKTEILNNYNSVINTYYNNNREGVLSNILNNIKIKLQAWTPIYNSDAINHYTCINVGSFIQFANENSQSPYDGSISITVDEEPHYPLVNGLVDDIDNLTRNTQIPTIGGLRKIFGQNFDKIGTKSAGSLYEPIYLTNGEFTVASNVVPGTFGTLKDGSSSGWKITNTSGTVVSIQATKVFGAVYNDYAEYRSTEAHPGRCIIENGNGTLSLSTGRLQLGANIVSDTYGFAIGETNEASCPVAVCGRVLAYPLESKELFTPGAAVCSGPEGTISLMTREEIREWPDAIVGYVSEVPTYDTWGTDNVPVDGRIWIKIK